MFDCLLYFLASIIFLNAFWYYGLIPSAIVIIFFDLLFVGLLLQIFNSFFTNKLGLQTLKLRILKTKTNEKKEMRSLIHVSSFPFLHRHKNLFMRHWMRKHPNFETFKLPLNRIAYLKVKYFVGPFSRYKYGSEISESFLKTLAEQQLVLSTYQGECHPQCLITELSETYVEYKAYMYYISSINRAFAPLAHSCSSIKCPTCPKMSLIPSEIPEGERLNPKEIAKGFEMTEEDKRREREFHAEMEESRKKLQSAQVVFSIMRQGRKDFSNSDSPSESDSDENVTCSLTHFMDRKK